MVKIYMQKKKKIISETAILKHFQKSEIKLNFRN